MRQSLERNKVHAGSLFHVVYAAGVPCTCNQCAWLFAGLHVPYGDSLEPRSDIMRYMLSSFLTPIDSEDHPRDLRLITECL